MMYIVSETSGGSAVLTFMPKQDNGGLMRIPGDGRERVRQWKSAGIIVIAALLAGCSSWLPSAKRDTITTWNTYDEARNTFSTIVPYKTTVTDLKRIGYDPFVTPNITLLTYIELLHRFLPNNSITKSDLDEGVQDCLAAKDACTAYELALKKSHEERFGNVFMDLFGFRRKTKVSGWEFNAFIILKEDLVVYKLSGGKPNIDELIDEKRPLGPLQDLGGDRLLRAAGL